MSKTWGLLLRYRHGERSQNSLATKHLLASGEGWSASDERCHAGPKDPAYEEAHSHISVSAVLSGTFVYRSAHARVVMAPGSLLLGEREACFCCSHEHSTGDHCISFRFDQALIEEVAHQLPRLSKSGFSVNRIPPQQALAPIFAEVTDLARHSSSSAGEELALRLAGAAFRLANSACDIKAHSRDEQRMSEAVRIIDRGLTAPLTIGTIAAELQMSRYHFLRTFHRTVGETPYRYILSRRLVLAAQRLSTTAHGVLEVAYACGFGDLSEFTRHFKTRFGVTPAAYRQQRRHLHHTKH